MGDDAHRVTFDDAAYDRRCWGSGATGAGCDLRATTDVGLCASCRTEISRRVEEARGQRRSAAGRGRVVEMNFALNCRGELVSRTSIGGDRPIAGWDDGEAQEFE